MLCGIKNLGNSVTHVGSLFSDVVPSSVCPDSEII